MKKKNILIVAAVTLGILLVPLILQLTVSTGVDGQGFNWEVGDFVVMGVLIFITGLLISLALQKTSKYRVIAVTLIVLVFLWLWAELAVGVFTTWGS